MLQDRIQEMFGEYESKNKGGNNLRFGKILLASTGLGRVEKRIVEEVFFKQSIGCVPVENILSNMHLSEYSPVMGLFNLNR